MKRPDHTEIASLISMLAPHDDQGSPQSDGRTIPPPPRELLERVVQRESEALGMLFDRYFDLLYGLAFRLLGNREAAEDATQDVFLKLHRAAPRLDPARDPAPWLVTITVNTCRSVHRSGAHRMSTRAVPVNGSTDTLTDLKNGGPSPDEGHERAEREAAVQVALMQLPEQLREIVILRDYQGLGHQEIAKIVELGHDAVRKRYSRALSQLADALKGKLG